MVKNGNLATLVRVPTTVLLSACLLVFAMATPTSADAWWHSNWGGFTIDVSRSGVGGTLRIPGGRLYHGIEGEGRRVDWQYGRWSSVGRLCTWRLEFTNWNSEGELVYIDPGATRTTCTNHGERKIYPPRYEAGKACVRLVVTGERIAYQCHGIGAT